MRPRILLSLFPLFFSGCLEVEFSTIVRPDGDLLRSEVVTGDSSEILSYGFLSPVDDSWTFRIVRTTGSSFDRTAEKLFPGAEALNAAMLDTSRPLLPLRVGVERRFLWFYTDITYRERYIRWNPFGLVPVGEYLSADDIARSMNPPSGGAALSLQDSIARERVGQKWTEWMYRDIFEAWYVEFMKGVRSLGDPSLLPAAVAAHKEEMFREGRTWWASAGAGDTVATIIARVLRSPAALRVPGANPEGFAAHARKLAFVGRVLGKVKRVTIEMPGRLLDSNAPSLEGNRGVWKGVQDMSYAADEELWMTSRVVNVWVVILTAVIVLAGLAALVISPFRSRTAGRGATAP